MNPTIMHKPNSDFIYRFVTVSGHETLLITDLNQGCMSVTNNIETVVEQIAREQEIELKELYQCCLIIYKDSEGVWDGWDGDFILLQCDNPFDAALKFIKILNHDISPKDTPTQNES